MVAVKLLIKLVLYYLALAAIVAILFAFFPMVHEFLPVGRVQALMADNAATFGKADAGIHIAHVKSFGGSIFWMSSAIFGAVLMALPVSWVYMAVRNPEDFDQSLISTIVMLPIVVTSIVVIVQDSLALSFSLAGIAGAARFRNSMKSSGDLLFMLLAIGIGLAAGIGAMELAFVTSAAFNLCFVALWVGEYGERQGMKRYLQDFDPFDAESGHVRVTEVSVTDIETIEPTKKH